jgi:recombination protein RecA
MRYRTGSIGLDRALGGGYEPGKMYEVWGDPGAAKTVLALHSVETFVRARKEVLWIDLNDGVRHMDSAPRVIVGRPRNAEDAFSMAVAACQWPGIDFVVVDPTQNLVRQAELDGDPEYTPHPQREYRLELNDLKTAAATHGTVILFVGQPRDKDREPVRGTGISEKVHYRIHLHADRVHQDDTREIQATVKDVPGKATIHNAAYFHVRPGEGIDQGLELAMAATQAAQIEKRGDWYYPRRGIGFHGIRMLAKALNDVNMLYREIDERVRAHYGI